MNQYLHDLAQSLKDLVDIFVSAHFFALLVINLTKTPYED